MTSTDDLLDQIDHALRDNEVSKDAMRWTPGPPPDEEERGLTAELLPAADRAESPADDLGAWSRRQLRDWRMRAGDFSAFSTPTPRQMLSGGTA
jgi:hypothetical protein